MKSKEINILRKTTAVMLIVVSLVLLNFIHVAYLPFLGKYLFSFIAFTYLVAIWKIVTRERLWKILSLLIPMVVFLWLASRGDNFSKVPFYYFDIIGILITIGYIVLTYIVYKKSNNTIGRDFATSVNATKTNMASRIENEADEVESDEQSRTPSSAARGDEIGGVEKQPLYRKSELEIGDVVTFNDYSDPENPGVERTLKIIGIDDSGVDVEDVVDGVPRPLPIKPEQITHVKGKEKNQTTGGDEIRLWDYITYLDEETGKQKQGRVIEISPEGEICVEARDEELNYPYPKYVSHENIIEK